jgi:imidazolonepropionase-like amidohydrolase
MIHPLRLLTLLLLTAAPAAAGEPVIYRAARLWPGDGPPIADAALVVRDGKVIAVGRRADVASPPDAIIRDLGDATIIPGLIAGETSFAERGRDDLLALTPHHRAVDGFDWYADYSAALSGGVTTVQISPGSRRLLPGQGAVVKLAGRDPESRTVREVESLRVLLGDAFKNPPRIYEPPVGAVSVDRPLDPTRPQLAGSLASAVAGLRAAFATSRAAKDSRDPFLRALAGSGTAKQPVRITAPGAADVHAALTLAQEFDLRLVLVEPAVRKEQLTSWKTHVTGIVLNTGVRPGALGDDSARVPVDAARDLRGEGFRVGLKPVLDADLKELLYLGGLFTSRLPAVDVLRMLTADAAELLGVGDRVGTLAAGKDADFVVLTGDPFALHTRVRTTYVEGEVAWEAKPAGGRKVIRASRILNGAGDVIANGAVLIDGRTIRAVRRDVSVPADAEEKQFANAVIVPGFIDLGTNIGVGGTLSSPIAFNAKLGDRLVRGDSAAKSARQGGLTTVLLSGPAPSLVLAFKLSDQPRVIREPVALKFALRGNLTSAAASLRDSLRTGKTYADGWTKYEADLAAYEIKKKEFDAEQAKKATEKKEPDKKEEEKKEPGKEEKKAEEKKPEPPKAPEKPSQSDALEPYRAVFAGKLPVLVEARREDAIRLAVAICRDEFNVKTALSGADDAHRVIGLLATKAVTVIAGPELVRTVEREDVNLPLVLSVHGVPFAFQSQATGGSRNLRQTISFSVRHGLGGDDGLRGLTATPAQFLGLDSIGTLVAGRDADLVVLSGMPFELSTRVLAVMIDGEWVYRDSE